MKKTISQQQVDDDMQPEYDFSGGVRGKYAEKLKENGYTIRIYHSDGTFSGYWSLSRSFKTAS